MKARKILSKEMFTLDEKDIKPNIRDSIISCTKDGDFTTPTMLANHLGISYNGAISTLHKLVKDGYFERIGMRYVKINNEGLKGKAFVFRRTNPS